MKNHFFFVIVMALIAFAITMGCDGPKEAAQPPTQEATSGTSTRVGKAEVISTLKKESEEKYAKSPAAQVIIKEAISFLSADDPAKALEEKKADARAFADELRSAADGVKQHVDVANYVQAVNKLESDLTAGYDTLGAALSNENSSVTAESLNKIQSDVQADFQAVFTNAKTIAEDLKEKAKDLGDEALNLAKTFVGDLADALESNKSKVAGAISGVIVAVAAEFGIPCEWLITLGSFIEEAVEAIISYLADLLRMLEKWLGDNLPDTGDFPIDIPNPPMGQQPPVTDGYEYELLGPCGSNSFMVKPMKVSGGKRTLDSDMPPVLNLTSVPNEFVESIKNAKWYSADTKDDLKEIRITLGSGDDFTHDDSRRAYRFIQTDKNSSYTYMPE